MIYSKKCKDIGAQLLRKIEIDIAIALFIKKNTHNQIQGAKMLISKRCNVIE
jgi:hypothetical protein